MLHELRLAFIALQFLTRVPVPRWVGFEPAWLQACLRHFPLVGAGVGLVAATVLWAALWWWPPPVAAALSVVATVWLTGAFHEDGLADTCDGLGGAVSRERALEIMKDSRIGSYGAVGLVLALVLKVAVLAGLAAQASGTGTALAIGALVWGHAASRAAPVALVWWLPYAGDAAHAKAKPLAMQTDGRSVAAAMAWLLLLAAGLMTWSPAVVWPLAAALLAGGVATALCARWLRRRLGGFTGDTLGFTQQIVELASLLAWAAVLGASGAALAPVAWR
jgi:adenosylcobinamide-GDP ribazoletransferase